MALEGQTFQLSSSLHMCVLAHRYVTTNYCSIHCTTQLQLVLTLKHAFISQFVSGMQWKETTSTGH